MVVVSASATVQSTEALRLQNPDEVEAIFFFFFEAAEFQNALRMLAGKNPERPVSYGSVCPGRRPHVIFPLHDYALIL
jgi:hypothetical protein